jgi:hypothetical protein
VHLRLGGLFCWVRCRFGLWQFSAAVCSRPSAPFVFPALPSIRLSLCSATCFLCALCGAAYFPPIADSADTACAGVLVSMCDQGATAAAVSCRKPPRCRHFTGVFEAVLADWVCSGRRGPRHAGGVCTPTLGRHEGGSFIC